MLCGLQKPFWAGTCLRHWYSSVMPMQFPDSPLSHFWWLTGTQILQCGLGSFVENLVSYVFLVFLCLHTHCRSLNHFQGKTGLILCCCLRSQHCLYLFFYLINTIKGGFSFNSLTRACTWCFLPGKPFFWFLGLMLVSQPCPECSSVSAQLAFPYRNVKN